jgi:thiamine pyrophosphokinase
MLFVQMEQPTDYMSSLNEKSKRFLSTSPDCIPHCIVGDFDSIQKEVKAFYEQKKVNMVIKKDLENTDLDKCLYISIEKLAYGMEESNLSNNKRFCFIILGSSGGRLDHTISTYHHVYKYLSYYPEQLAETEIFMVSKSSISVFLRNGTNIIDSSDKIQNRSFGYSIIALHGEADINVTDDTEKPDDTKGK